MPFIIHKKQSGAPLEGLTQGIMTGFEMRRQREKDQLLQEELEMKREESVVRQESYKAEAALKRIETLTKQSALDAAEARRQAIAGDITAPSGGLAAPGAAYTAAGAALSSMGGAGVAGRGFLAGGAALRGLGMATRAQTPYDAQLARGVMQIFGDAGLDTVNLDTPFQGIATDPEVTSHLQAISDQYRYKTAQGHWGSDAASLKAKEAWITKQHGRIEELVRHKTQEGFNNYMSDPRQTPQGQDAWKDEYFDGVHRQTWDTWTAALAAAEAAFADNPDDVNKIYASLEEAETALHKGYAADLQWKKQQTDVEEQDLMAKLQTMAGTEEDAAIIGTQGAYTPETSTSKIIADWQYMLNRSGEAGLENERNAAYMAVWGRAHGYDTGAVQERQEHLSQQREWAEGRERYQNTIDYHRSRKTQRQTLNAVRERLASPDYAPGGKHGSLKAYEKHEQIIADLEGGFEYTNKRGEVMTARGMRLDYDTWGDIFDEALADPKTQAAATISRMTDLSALPPKEQVAKRRSQYEQEKKQLKAGITIEDKAFITPEEATGVPFLTPQRAAGPIWEAGEGSSQGTAAQAEFLGWLAQGAEWNAITPNIMEHPVMRQAIEVATTVAGAVEKGDIRTAKQLSDRFEEEYLLAGLDPEAWAHLSSHAFRSTEAGMQVKGAKATVQAAIQRDGELIDYLEEVKGMTRQEARKWGMDHRERLYNELGLLMMKNETGAFDVAWRGLESGLGRPFRALGRAASGDFQKAWRTLWTSPTDWNVKDSEWKTILQKIENEPEGGIYYPERSNAQR